MVEIIVLNRQQDVPIHLPSVESAISFVLQQMQAWPDEVACHFVSKSEISELHQVFFDDPTPTDCISLPIDAVKTGGYQCLGEIFVCPQVAREYVLQQHLPHDVYHETTLYVIHGLLHLLGYDDLEDRDRLLMEAKQQELLELLKQHALILSSPQA